MSIITIERKILEKNDVLAKELHKEFSNKRIFVINLISSPGSGKTSLIEQLSAYHKKKFNMAVIVGDPQTDNDARRVNALGVPVVQIITNGACHLDAMLVRDALEKLNSVEYDLLIIENVGNLVCPAGFDLGEDIKIVLLSTTEGDDKPLKYPVIFRKSSAFIINKNDLIPYLQCSISEIIKNAHNINPDLTVFQTSCVTGNGLSELAEWISNKIQSK